MTHTHCESWHSEGREHGFEAILGYTASSCHKINQQKQASTKSGENISLNNLYLEHTELLQAKGKRMLNFKIKQKF